MTDPNSTAKSTISLSSVNLDKINAKNAERLARLENADNLNDSGFRLTMGSQMGSAQKRPDIASRPPLPDFRQSDDRPQQKHQISELAELDDMLADILRDKAK